jgi:hypothetical protein
MISSMLKPCILVDELLCGLTGGSRDVDGPGSESEVRTRRSGGSGTLLRNMPSPMLVPGVGSALATVAEEGALCRSRRICRWGRCAGSGGGWGRIVYEDVDES